MQQRFRIIKEDDKSYRLMRKLPPNLSGDKNMWAKLREVFNNPLEAELHAHELVMSKNSNVVKEFSI
jgi:hypothetical protein